MKNKITKYNSVAISDPDEYPDSTVKKNLTTEKHKEMLDEEI
jgi:hypothetical protein